MPWPTLQFKAGPYEINIFACLMRIINDSLPPGILSWALAGLLMGNTYTFQLSNKKRRSWQKHRETCQKISWTSSRRKNIWWCLNLCQGKSEFIRNVASIFHYYRHKLKCVQYYRQCMISAKNKCFLRSHQMIMLSFTFVSRVIPWQNIHIFLTWVW